VAADRPIDTEDPPPQPVHHRPAEQLRYARIRGDFGTVRALGRPSRSPSWRPCILPVMEQEDLRRAVAEVAAMSSEHQGVWTLLQRFGFDPEEAEEDVQTIA
jgi:hypothetical protein